MTSRDLKHMAIYYFNMADGRGGSTPSIAQALNSLAGALSPLIQQSVQSPLQPLQTTVSTPPVSIPPVTSNSYRTPHILPSFLRRKGNQGGSKPKKQKTVQTWDRDIICLPWTRQNYSSNMSICYPRGRYRSELGRMGLIGKIHLTSEMSEDDIMREIRSVFQVPMGGDPEFPFVFLQPAGEGTRTLVIPAQSSSFKWTAQQVARLAGQKNTTYILAQADMPSLKGYDNEVSDDDDPQSPQPRTSSANQPPSPQRQSSSANQPQPRSSANQPSSRQTRSSSANQLSLSQPRSSSDSSVTLSQPRLSSVNQSQSSSVVKLDPYSQYINLIDLTKDSESESDDDLPSIHISTNHGTDNPFDPVSTKHLLVQHQQSIMIGLNEDDYQRINVRRAYLFKDAFKQFSKISFNVYKRFRVVFIGEQAVDEGGPRREFFHFLMRDCFEKSGLFIGYPDHVVPIHNVEAVDKDKFSVIGKMISTSLIQGGEAPSCFAKAVADYIVYNQVRSKVCVEDIPDVTIQHILKEILSANTNEELQSVFEKDSFDFLFTCGYNKPICQIKVLDRENLVKAVWLHYVIFHPHAELEQLKKGMYDTLGVDALMTSHPDLMWGLLAASKTYDITADYLSDSFVVHYSDNGSNNRTKEEAIILFWFDYIYESKDRQDVTLSRILQFYSGSSKIPAAGFPTDPKIYFSSEDNRLPWASTCDLSITFPRYMGILDEDEFRDKMDLCILGSFGFGTV